MGRGPSVVEENPLVVEIILAPARSVETRLHHVRRDAQEILALLAGLLRRTQVRDHTLQGSAHEMYSSCGFSSLLKPVRICTPVGLFCGLLSDRFEKPRIGAFG